MPNEEQCSAEGLTDGEWKNHLLLEEPIGTQFSAHVLAHWIQSVLQKNGKKRAEAVMTRGNCKNRNRIAGRSIDIDWHACPGDTSVQILQKLQRFTSETGHGPESFPYKDVQRRHQLGKLQGAKNVQLKRMTWPLAHPDSDLAVGVSVVEDQNRPGRTTVSPICSR